MLYIVDLYWPSLSQPRNWNKNSHQICILIKLKFVKTFHHVPRHTLFSEHNFLLLWCFFISPSCYFKVTIHFFKNKLVLHIVHSYKMEFAIHQSKFLIIIIIIIIILILIIIVIIIIGIMAILTFIKIRHDKENARMKWNKVMANTHPQCNTHV
jgi:hypothetical protein